MSEIDTPQSVRAQADLERRDKGDVLTEAMLRSYATLLEVMNTRAPLTIGAEND